jgi:hypothetical protein
MSFSNIPALASAASAIFKTLDTSVEILKKILSKKQLSKGDDDKASEVIDITKDKEKVISSLKEMLDFLMRLLPEVAKLHAFSDKLSEIIVANKTVLRGANQKGKNECWKSANDIYQKIVSVMNSIILINSYEIPLPNSQEIGTLKQNCKNFEDSLREVSGFIVNQNTDMVDAACKSMSRYSANVEAFVGRYTRELLDCIFM